MKWILALALTALSWQAVSAERNHRFYGYVYDLETNRYLYTEVHNQRLDGDRWLGGTMNYFSPEGEKIGTKTMDFSQNPYIPIYRLDQFNVGYVEGIKSIGDEVELYKQEDAHSKLKTTRVDLVPNMAADSGFHSFIRAHFAELLRGEKVSFRLIAAGQLDEYGFRLRKAGDLTFEGKPAINIIAEPDSLLRLLVDPLVITYDPATQKLLEYRGVSNIHDPNTGKPYVARVLYSDHVPDDAPKKLPPLK